MVRGQVSLVSDVRFSLALRLFGAGRNQLAVPSDPRGVLHHFEPRSVSLDARAADPRPPALHVREWTAAKGAVRSELMNPVGRFRGSLRKWTE